MTKRSGLEPKAIRKPKNSASKARPAAILTLPVCTSILSLLTLFLAPIHPSLFEIDAKVAGKVLRGERNASGRWKQTLTPPKPTLSGGADLERDLLSGHPAADEFIGLVAVFILASLAPDDFVHRILPAGEDDRPRRFLALITGVK
jgi:hypothetical protein